MTIVGHRFYFIEAQQCASKNLGDDIDPGVGFVLDAHVGSLMVVDEPWITVYHRGELSAEHRNLIEQAIQLSNDPVDAESRIIEIL